MKQEHQIIIDLISEYLTNHYDVRFGQALFNLRINEFANRNEPEKKNIIRDIHNDADEVIVKRIKSQLEWFEEQRKRR